MKKILKKYNEIVNRYFTFTYGRKKYIDPELGFVCVPKRIRIDRLFVIVLGVGLFFTSFPLFLVNPSIK